MQTAKRICLWSSPRNVSTALMYSFRQRSDTRVVDEPLYAHYLQSSGAQHPGRDAILAAMDADASAVLDGLLGADYGCPVLFIKSMVHHLPDGDEERLTALDNLFLIRDPARIISSYARVLPSPGVEDLGIIRQLGLFQYLCDQGRTPPVLDAGELLRDPAGVLGRLCTMLGLPFDAAMLAWPAGPKAEDGVWAPWWYAGVHRSTGFLPPSDETPTVPQHLQTLHERCRPAYQELFHHAIKA